MSRNFIVIKVNLDLWTKLLHVVYIVAIIIVGRTCTIIYQKIQYLEGALDRAGVLELFPPRNRTWELRLLVRICSCIIIVNYTCMKLCMCLFDYSLDHIHIISLSICLFLIMNHYSNEHGTIMYYVIFQCWSRSIYPLLCITVC